MLKKEFVAEKKREKKKKEGTAKFQLLLDIFIESKIVLKFFHSVLLKFYFEYPQIHLFY